MLSDHASEGAIPTGSPRVAPGGGGDDGRVRAMFEMHFDFIWRSLRRFGLSDDRADDAAQQVFVVASRKLTSIQPGSERSFLIGTAMRVASDVRRSAPYRREIAHADPGAELEGGFRPDELVEQRQARALLDAVLDTMELDLRTVFVLFEIEELSTAEIAELLAIPHGTVASRLRRARDEFESSVERFRRGVPRPAGGGR
jgi:RNA polymerase sigma-70 factor (ECF subfamily)